MERVRVWRVRSRACGCGPSLSCATVTVAVKLLRLGLGEGNGAWGGNGSVTDARPSSRSDGMTGVGWDWEPVRDGEP